MIGTGIGCTIRPDFVKKSWSSYWTSQTDTFLFFGQTKNISGGRLNNEMQGSSDFLTVTGTPGSYTFQCPNNATYIAADTDHVWFTPAAIQRTTTEVELVGYDIPRTPIKYDDSAPYAIRWVAILKSGVTLTADELNKLHLSFKLPLFWSGVLNTNGVLKGNRGLAQQPWIAYESELIAYMALLTTPLSEGHTVLLNNFILALKSGLSITNLSDIFDVIQIYANETAEAALKNLVQNAYHATAQNSPVFTTLEGYQHIAATSYIDTGYNPGGVGTFNYKQDNCFYGYYSRTDVGETTIDCGVNEGGISAFAYTWMASIGNKIRMRLNDATNHEATLTDSLGLYIHSRPAAATVKCYKNGINIVVINATQASTGIPNANFYTLTVNSGGTPGAYCNRQISLFFAGSGLSEAQSLVIHNAFEAYMDANGKGVVV